MNNKRTVKVKKGKGMTAVILVLVLFILGGVFAYVTLKNGMQAPGTSEEIVPFEVAEGDTYGILGEKLEAAGLIKSALIYKVYLKTLKNLGTLYAGYYPLSSSMDLKTVVDTISSGKTFNPFAFNVTFPEGSDVPDIARIVSKNTDTDADSFIAAINNREFLKRMIDKYWFLTDEILAEGIFYPLEGYLFPNTYQLTGKDMAPTDIAEMMLQQTDAVLTEFKSEIEASGRTVHQIMTMASIVEMEAGNATDRAGVAGVFYNRLNSGWTLGSDVTCYYGIQVDMSERDLYLSEINAYTPYNTRCVQMAGKLPVGPIANPGKESIHATINPTGSGYYYFVADKNGNVYFSVTLNEHNATIQRLKNEGLWYEYE